MLELGSFPIARAPAIPDITSASPPVNSMQSDSKPYVVDFSNAVPVAVENGMGTSANLGKVVSSEGERFYLKDAVSYDSTSPVVRNAITSREVVSTEIYSLFLPAPKARMVNECSCIMEGADNEKIFIASRLENYQDFGDCLIKEELADDLEQQFKEFTHEDAAAFKHNAVIAKTLTGELTKLRDQHLDWWVGVDGNPDQELVQVYRAKALQLEEVMQKQFHILPEALQRQSQDSLGVSQLLGDWDPFNVFYKNMGIVKKGDGSLHVMRLDFGSCLDVGFQGQTKENGYETAVSQRPAVFPELKHRFKREDAVFSEKLPLLAQEFHTFPYADHAQSIAGKTEWAHTTRMKIGYRCSLLMQQKGSAQNAFETIIKTQLMNAPGFKSADDLIQVLHARMDALIDKQCGGSHKIMEWEQNNPELSGAIRADLLSRLSIPTVPLVKTQTHSYPIGFIKS